MNKTLAARTRVAARPCKALDSHAEPAHTPSHIRIPACVLAILSEEDIRNVFSCDYGLGITDIDVSDFSGGF